MKVRDETYQYYFFFIQERMNIFWRRYEGLETHLTDDPILAKHKFTNVYRALDRVSQYLIRNVITEKEYEFSDVDNLLELSYLRSLITSTHGNILNANLEK